MQEKVFLKVRNEATALPRVLRVVDRQGATMESLVVRTVDNGRLLDIELYLSLPGGASQLCKLLAKQVAVVAVEKSMPVVMASVAV